MPSKVPKVHPLIKRWKIVSGDMVQVVRGRSTGERGKVVRVLRKQNAVLVEGLNLVKRHQRGTKEHAGGIFTRESPIHYSNVQLIDPTDNNPCKIKWGFLEDGTKVRMSRRSDAIVKKPEEHGVRVRRKDGDTETPAETVRRVTYEKPAYLADMQRLLLREESGVQV